MGTSADHPDYPTAADQYKTPAPDKSSGWAWAGFGDSYANESDPSWEDVIAMVVIPGDPDRVKAAAGMWDTLFSNIRDVKTLLDDGIKDLETWKGDGGAAYRAYLTEISKTCGTLISDNQLLTANMNTAADNLQTALNQIQVPDDMLYEVRAAKESHVKTGTVNANVCRPGSIFDTLMPILGNKWMDELRENFTWTWAQKNLRDWISNEDEKAKAVFNTLAANHVSTMNAMPTSVEFNPRDTGPVKPVDTKSPGTGTTPHAATPAAGKTPKIPTAHTPDPTAKPKLPTDSTPANPGIPTNDLGNNAGAPPSTGTGLNPDTGLSTPGNASMPGASDYTTPAYTTPDYSTGLAGVGGSGLSGLGSGSGLGGLGAGGGSGTGGGASGIGAGAGGLGSAGAARGGLPGVGGIAPSSSSRAGAGRLGGAGGAAGGTRAATRGGMGGMGAGTHGGGGGEGDHSTWLNEDEDIWGTDSDAPPSVLG